VLYTLTTGKEQKGIVQVYRIIAKSGENRWVEDHKTSLFSQEGQFVGIDGIAFDITERKRAAHALEYRSNLEKIIMNISRKFINLSSEQINEGINQALKALGEFAEVDRSYIFQFFDEGRKTSNTHEWCAEGITPQVDNLQNISVDTLPWWMDKLGRFENINIPDVEKLPARAKNEKQILQAQSIQSLIVIPMVYNRQLIGFVGFDSVRRQRTCSEETAAMLTIVSEIFVNVLMRRRIGQELAAHHEKMRRAEQLASLGTLSATIAHELNQPLTVMRLFLQQGLRALKDDNDGDKVAEVIDDCLNELTKAARIVDRFRRFARKSAPVYIAKVNLVEVANGIVEILAGTARREKLNLSFTVESCPPYIIGNSLEIEQMFFVLIQNAIQAADGKTERELAISISSQGDQVHLTFADTCSGIRKEDIDKIFEPFFTTKPANLGTGLGLCILERIVKRHGGSVRVESRFGRGTIFYICLPIKS
jgi:signal transduction histidine kinase